ncbi:flavodoxin family protein [Nocardioides sp.]|uniref:flavodoxin family protein n=1 Tax=Nocardioides sp. TaxID=35761 RepID=UPI002D809FF4|nr:flavodoxin domain-containing protein [Nocardioides sp.]HET8960851.1 flavodoxin domain-containing protein [Nocardioides sp.]
MKTVIVYESMFGNTEHIARKVADGLAEAGSRTTLADVREVGPDDLAEADLVVIGAPTHAFSLSRQSTREDAVRQGADPSRAALGVREWLDTFAAAFPLAAERPRVAVFDTRVEKVRRLPGSAAKRAAKALRAHGFALLDRPTSFYVADVHGPTTFGEFYRAHDWGARLFELARQPDLEAS